MATQRFSNLTLVRAWTGKGSPVLFPFSSFCILHFFHKCPGQLDSGIPFKLQSKWLQPLQWWLLFEVLSCSLVSFLYNKREIWHINILEEDTYLDLQRHPQIFWSPCKLRQIRFFSYLFFQVWVAYMDLVLKSLALLTFVLL